MNNVRLGQLLHTKAVDCLEPDISARLFSERLSYRLSVVPHFSSISLGFCKKSVLLV